VLVWIILSPAPTHEEKGEDGEEEEGDDGGDEGGY
jgi:hypothetical protein